MVLAIKSPNPSSAMEWFIKSIPMMVPGLPELALSTLLYLIPNDLEEDPSDNNSSNPLFDEDPINEYAEDVLLLQHISRCLTDLFAKHKELTHELILDYLHTSTGSAKVSKRDEEVNISIWENPKQFMTLVRWNFLQHTLEDVGSSTNNQENYSALIHLHPIFL